MNMCGTPGGITTTSPLTMRRLSPPTMAEPRHSLGSIGLASGAVPPVTSVADVVATWIQYIPMVKSRHDVTDGQLGFMLLSMVAGGVLGLPLAGWLVSRFGSRLVAIATAAGLSLMLPAPV